MMNLSFLITDITTSGGTERTTSLLANTFVRRGHDVTIVSLFRRNKKVIYELDSRVNVVFLICKSYNASYNCFRRIGLLVRAGMAVREYFKKCTYDVIIGQAFISNFLLWLTNHAKVSLACEHYKYDVYNGWVRRFRNRIYRRFRRVVVLTEHDAQRYKIHGLKVCVIPNMLSFSLVDNKGAGSKRIISVGRLHPQKGYDLLLEAVVPVFKRFPEWHLDIYGEGEDEEKLKLQRDRLGLQRNVFFKGFSSDIREEYISSSFYVMSSRFEGFPMTLLESLACGLPVVSFNCPEGPSDLLESGGGCLAEAENIVELTACLLRMIEDDSFRMSCAVQCHAIARKYTAEKIYGQWMLLFDGLKE